MTTTMTRLIVEIRYPRKLQGGMYEDCVHGDFRGQSYWDEMPKQSEQLQLVYVPTGGDSPRSADDEGIVYVGRVRAVIRTGSGQRGVVPRGSVVVTRCDVEDEDEAHDVSKKLLAMGFERD